MSKIWFITGANSGIGAGIVKAVLESGDSVVAAGRSITKLRAAFADIDSDRLALVQLDVTNRAQADTAIAEAVARFGRLDVVVNNAGIAVLGYFEALSASDFERQLAPNLYGVLNVLHAALPVMRKQRSGHIINISSMAGAAGGKQGSAYSASKFALEGLSLALAAEVEDFGINITIVEPGFFRSKLLDTGNASFIDTDIKDYDNGTSARETWAPYDGKQNGDPLKLGKALVKIAAMEQPLKLFLAGSDAVEGLLPVAEGRLQMIKDNRELSSSTDGVDR
jgi:NAD(P)-dependent dehydrogenase (short-subunit alcohol dehydrogenase family)